MAKRQNSRSRARVPKARRLRRSSLTRKDVTRGEYNRIIDILNERNTMLNALRDGLQRLEQASDIQFKRTAQIQADLDALKREWERMKAAS